MDGKDLLADFIKGKSQAEFARQVRCSEGHLSLILAGKRKASAELALRISAASGVPARTLVSDKILLDAN